MYLADQVPVSCPTCGHFVAYSVDHCGTCSEDLSGIDLKELAQVQWGSNMTKRGGLAWLIGLVAVSWFALYFVV